MENHAEAEFDASIRRIMHYAAWADKFDGQVHSAPINGMVFAVNEPLGNTACVAPDEVPLLGLLSVVLPLVALGNVVTVVPSETNPVPACELYRVLDCSGSFRLEWSTLSPVFGVNLFQDTGRSRQSGGSVAFWFCNGGGRG